jgi:hypothetical protein
MARILGKFSRDDVFRFLTFAAFALALVFCASRHAPWRDEFQTFLVATRVDSFSEFWMATRYERTPPLHYAGLALLWPLFREILEPRTFISCVTILFSLLTAFLLLFRLRFPLWIAFLSLFGIFFFREWGVISRSYGIGAALLFLSLDLKLRGRKGWGSFFLALAGMTHTLFLAGCGVLFAFELWERLRTRERFERADIGTVLATVLFTIAAIHQVPPKDTLFASDLYWPGAVRFVGRWFQNLGVVFLPIERANFQTWRTGEGWIWNQVPIRFGWGVAVFALLVAEFRRARGALWRFFAATAPLFLIFICAQGGAFRYYGVVFAIFLYLWAESEARRLVSANWKSFALFVVPALSTVSWLVIWNPIRPRFDFSDAPRVASRVDEESRTVFALQSHLAFSVMAATGKSIYDLALGRFVEYPLFRSSSVLSEPLKAVCSPEPLLEIKAGDFILVSLGDLGSLETLRTRCPGWKEVYRTTGSIVTDERFVLFERSS